MFHSPKDTQGLSAVPADMFGTRQAIFHLMRDRDRKAAPPAEQIKRQRPARAPALPEGTDVLVRDLMSDDQFVF
jgi:hypothetical protein